MKIGIILQARISSARLPGKVLKLLQNRPMLAYTIERLQQLELPFILATSSEESDDPIEEFCKATNVQFFRGSLEDVASRFLNAAKAQGWDAFVRICGDSPFIDQKLIQDVVEVYRDREPDMVTNTFPKTYPKGQSVELVKTDSFESAYTKFKDGPDKEHVTKYFYDHAGDFKIEKLGFTKDLSHKQLSVDTIEDFIKADTILQMMSRPHWEYSWNEILKMEEDIS